MITGPVLAGSWLAAYYGTGVAVEEPAPAPPQPTGATGPGGPSYPGWGRYKGSRQEFIDGEWRDADTAVEEIGGPPRREPQPAFEPPQPWTPEESEPAPQTAPVGTEGLGITVPKPRSVPPAPERRRRKLVTRRVEDDNDAMAALLAAIGATWQ